MIVIIEAASPRPLVSETPPLLLHRYMYAYLTKISAAVFAWHACEVLEVV